MRRALQFTRRGGPAVAHLVLVRSMRRVWLVRSVTVTAAALTTAIVGFLATADSHHINLRYLLWKRHLWPYSPSLALRYFNVDTEFRTSLEGKTQQEIKQWFPVLYSKDESDAYQRCYAKDIADPDFVWIDRSWWGIHFREGKVNDIRLFKG